MELLQPRFWSKVIGVIEMIMQIVATGFFAYVLFQSIKGGEAFVKELSADYTAFAQYYQFGYKFFWAVAAILLFTSGLGILMASKLLKGAFSRDYNRLNHWMVYAIMAAGVIFLLLLTYGGHVWYVVIRSFVFIVIRGVMIWCVYVDLKDLEGETQTEDKQRFAQQQHQQHSRAQNIDTTAI